MKIVVAHNSPDWDAITSVWLIKRFLPGWDGAAIEFVPAGSRLKNQPVPTSTDPIEKIGQDEVIHVDTGLGPLDHHQTQDKNVCGASLTFDYIKKVHNLWFVTHDVEGSERTKHREEAVGRLVKVVVDIDHFGEVFWADPAADYHEFSLLGVLDGLKLLKPNEDMYYVDIGMNMLDAVLHDFENRTWAEKVIKENGIVFDTKWGKGIGFSTINDTVISLAQKMGYALVVRKDPRKGYVRIKARPALKSQISNSKSQISTNNQNSNPEKLNVDIDLTLVYEKLKKMDPEATWFLHISKKMLLNGTVKNPKMKPTTLSLQQIIQVLEKV